MKEKKDIVYSVIDYDTLIIEKISHEEWKKRVDAGKKSGGYVT